MATRIRHKYNTDLIKSGVNTTSAYPQLEIPLFNTEAINLWLSDQIQPMKPLDPALRCGALTYRHSPPCHNRDKQQWRPGPSTCLPTSDSGWVILAHSQKRLPTPVLIYLSAKLALFAMAILTNPMVGNLEQAS